MSTNTKFTRDSHLTTIALGYKNLDVNLIADLVCPRVPVDSLVFEYTTYPEAEMYDIPDTDVGEYDQMTSSKVSGTTVQSKCEDKGHQVALTNRDITQTKQPKGGSKIDPKERAAMKTTNVVKLAREKRVAKLFFDPNNYDAAMKNQLDGSAGHKKWTDKVSATPLDDVNAMLDACLVRPNTFVFGRAAWSAFRRHPQIVKACGSSTGEGQVSRQQVADLFEVNEVLIGESMSNTAKVGKAAVLSRLWGPALSMFYRDRTADAEGGITFATTFEFNAMQSGTIDLDIGVEGGTAVRTFETLKEVVIARKAAALIYDAV